MLFDGIGMVGLLGAERRRNNKTRRSVRWEYFLAQMGQTQEAVIHLRSQLLARLGVKRHIEEAKNLLNQISARIAEKEKAQQCLLRNWQEDEDRLFLLEMEKVVKDEPKPEAKKDEPKPEPKAKQLLLNNEEVASWEVWASRTLKGAKLTPQDLDYRVQVVAQKYDEEITSLHVEFNVLRVQLETLKADDAPVHLGKALLKDGKISEALLVLQKTREFVRISLGRKLEADLKKAKERKTFATMNQKGLKVRPFQEMLRK